MNSTFINTQETRNGTRNLSLRNIQITSQFIDQEIVEKLHYKQSISPLTKIIHFHRQLSNQQKNKLLPQNDHKKITKHIDQ